MAKTAQEAIQKESKYAPDDVWIDPDWKEDKVRQLESCIGFVADSERDYE